MKVLRYHNYNLLITLFFYFPSKTTTEKGGIVTSKTSFLTENLLKTTGAILFGFSKVL